MAAAKSNNREMPHNLEAERGVITAMLHDQQALQSGLEILRSADQVARQFNLQRIQRQGKKTLDEELNLFYSDTYQILFEAISEIESLHLSPDVSTLMDRLQHRNALEKVGGVAELITLSKEAPTGTNVRQLAQNVLEKFLLRRVIVTSHEVMEQAYSAQVTPEEILATAEQEFRSMSDTRLQKSFIRVSQVLEKVQQGLMESRERKGVVTGVQTHFHKLDEMTSGFQKSDLLILAARPSVGKTAFSLNIVENVAARSGVPVGIFSLEMSTEQIVQRLICSMAQVDLQKMRSGHLNNRQMSNVISVLGRLSPLPIYVDDTPGLSISAVRSRALRLKQQEPDLGLLVIDYLQLMEAAPGTGRQRNRQEEVSAISRGLKGLARELELPVLALSQLSRGVEGRESGIPRLSDLRESGAIEQDADVVMFIHRRRPSEEDDPEHILAQIIIGKQRNGPVGEFDVVFISEYAAFKNYAGQQYSEDDLPPVDMPSEENADVPF